MTHLKNKTALITGSTSGIGLGMARALAAQGCNIVLNGFGEDADIEKLRQAIAQEYDVTVIYHGANMMKPSEIRELVTYAAENFGGIDILINNAGIQRVNPIEAFKDEDWDDIIAVNMSSVFHTMKACIPYMKEQGWGRIINTASVHGLVASVHKTAYVAAKHGVVGMTKVVALETAGSGITCNAICPGWVKTDLIDQQIELRAEKNGISKEEATRDLLSEKQPSQQFTTPEDLGNLAVFLCSSAANQMTGISLPVDGGWTAQ